MTINDQRTLRERSVCHPADRPNGRRGIEMDSPIRFVIAGVRACRTRCKTDRQNYYPAQTRCDRITYGHTPHFFPLIRLDALASLARDVNEPTVFAPAEQARAQTT